MSSAIPPGGTSPASAFTVNEQAEQVTPPGILADKIDPATGELESILEGRGIADGMAIQLLRTRRGSGASVRDLGQRFQEVSHVEDETPEVLASLAREALQPGADEGILRVRQVQIEVEEADGTQVNGSIDYVDLLAPPDEANRRFTFEE